tara:strand:- start:384 stop:848 length:465 start_codon:yes stop_codon:yes gene_type:complete
MKKRGVSPLIAVVLLIAILFGLSIILINFVQDFTDKRTEEIDFTSKLNTLCVEKSILDVEDMTCSSNDVNLSIKNTGSYPVHNITFMFFSDSGSTYTTGTDSFHSEFMFKKYDFTLDFDSVNLEKIQYFKNLDVLVDNETVVGRCNPVEIEIIC